MEDALMVVKGGPTADLLAYTTLKVRSIRESIIEIDTAVSKACCRAVIVSKTKI